MGRDTLSTRKSFLSPPNMEGRKKGRKEGRKHCTHARTHARWPPLPLLLLHPHTLTPFSTVERLILPHATTKGRLVSHRILSKLAFHSVFSAFCDSWCCVLASQTHYCKNNGSLLHLVLRWLGIWRSDGLLRYPALFVSHCFYIWVIFTTILTATIFWHLLTSTFSSFPLPWNIAIPTYLHTYIPTYILHMHVTLFLTKSLIFRLWLPFILLFHPSPSLFSSTLHFQSPIQLSTTRF